MDVGTVRSRVEYTWHSRRERRNQRACYDLARTSAWTGALGMVRVCALVPDAVGPRRFLAAASQSRPSPIWPGRLQCAGSAASLRGDVPGILPGHRLAVRTWLCGRGAHHFLAQVRRLDGHGGLMCARALWREHHTFFSIAAAIALALLLPRQVR